MKNILLYSILISIFVSASERQAIRALYKDDQVYQWLAQSPDDSKVCGICLDPGRLQRLSCHPTHQFHSHCIDEWKQIKSNCAICRAAIVDSLLCTCLKSLTKPGVCMPLCMGLVYMLGKSAYQINEYIQLAEISSLTLAQHCSGCSSLCAYCSAVLALGPVIIWLKNKTD